MLRAAYSLLKASGRVFLEAAAEGLSAEAIGQAMAEHPPVREIDDLHVWDITSGFPALSAHVLVGQGADCYAVRRQLEALLAERFSIDHTTLQVDHAEQGRLLRIGPSAQPGTTGSAKQPQTTQKNAQLNGASLTGRTRA